MDPDRSLTCVTVSTPQLWPTCEAGTQALSKFGGDVVCVDKGTGATSPTLAAKINSATMNATNLGAQISTAQSTSAVYCGQTANTYSGRFSDGTRVGIAAAGSACAAIASCGQGAHMCSVYEMYESVALGAITQSMTISKAWVYMASWSQEFSDNSGTRVNSGAGLADNCGSYTTADASKKWYGTVAEWTLADTGKKALKFYTGPASVGIPGTTMQTTNPGATSCSSTQPIACCR